MEADDVERARVEVNRRAREEAGAARQPRAGGSKDLPLGDATTGDDDNVNAGGAAGNTAPLVQGAGRTASGADEAMPESSPGGAAGNTAPRVTPPWEMSQRPNGACEIFCKIRFTSRTSSFALHPGFAIDFATRWNFDEPDQEAEAFKLSETMRTKLLVGPPECTGLTVKEHPGQKVTGWLTNSRCIADEQDTFHFENRTQPKHHSTDE